MNTPNVQPTEAEGRHQLITASAVRRLCGGISDMTLWRWLNVSESKFPSPIYIGARRYWREAEVVAWLDDRPTISPHHLSELRATGARGRSGN